VSRQEGAGTALRDRLAERTQRGTRGRPPIPHRRLILGAGAAVLLAAVIVWLLAFSSVFAARNVTVRGVHQLSAAQVRHAAAIDPGTPLLRLNSGAVAHRVQRLPDVAAARVSTSFPSTVVITVTERTPVGYVHADGGYTLVDTTGLQYRTVHAKPGNLPLFVVPKGADSRTTGGAVARVAAALPKSLLHRVTSIQALDPDAITLLLTDNRIVRWGSAAHSAQKARILPTLLRQHGTQFDVTNPDLPFAH
jgi:cell division protein FtsQ